MSAPGSSRLVRRGTTALRLIEGGTPPGGARRPVTLDPPDVVGCYLEWLRLERQALGEELGLLARFGSIPILGGAAPAQRHHQVLAAHGAVACPSTRAALVLSAVGCDWKAGEP